MAISQLLIRHVICEMMFICTQKKLLGTVICLGIVGIAFHEFIKKWCDLLLYQPVWSNSILADIFLKQTIISTLYEP